MSDDWWTDYRQNRRIRELQDEVEAARSHAARRSRALQSKLSQVQGTLERRLDRLATSFDAFVELSDIRLELAVFDRESDVRHRTRRLLTGLSQGASDPPPLDLEDCPGYWLKPAAEGLSAHIRGDEAAADKFIAEAVSRDEDRTTLFLTLGLATAGRHDEAVPWLSRSLPSLGTTVTAVQRQLWIACANGAFGQPGRDHIERRLAELLDEMPPEATDRERGRWQQAISGPSGKRRMSLPRELQGDTSLTEPPVMAERMTVLRTRVERALRPFEPAPASDFDDLLNTLVDEGSPDERELVARARELRQIIETGSTERHVAWDAPAGETLNLLRGDMFERTADGPRALAARVGGRWLRWIADDLARRMSVPLPGAVTVRVSGHALQVGPHGAPALEETLAAIDRSAAISRTGESQGLAVAIIGAVVLVLTVMARLPMLTVPAAVMILVGVAIWIKLWRDRRRATRTVEDDKALLSQQAKTIAEALKECHISHRKLIANAASDRDVILTVLA
jgi:hypothetical protein